MHIDLTQFDLLLAGENIQWVYDILADTNSHKIFLGELKKLGLTIDKMVDKNDFLKEQENLIKEKLNE
jgi:hypothetical protein